MIVDNILIAFGLFTHNSGVIKYFTRREAFRNDLFIDLFGIYAATDKFNCLVGTKWLRLPSANNRPRIFPLS